MTGSVVPGQGSPAVVPAAQRAMEVFMSEGCNDAGDRGGRKVPSIRPSITWLDYGARAAFLKQLRCNGVPRVQTFGAIPSKRNARLVVPIGRQQPVVGGLEIWQPYAWRAKLLKRALIVFCRLGWTGWARDVAVVQSQLPLEIEELVTRITGERQPCFALSLGTPGKYRKLSIRVMGRTGNLLGYVKLPLEPAAVFRVRHEAKVLESLNRSPRLRPHMPSVLYAGDWGDRFILFQSAGGTRPGPVEFGELHRSFLEGLGSVELAEIPGAELVRREEGSWKACESDIPPQWRAMAEETFRQATRALQETNVACGICHGDFAPWNTAMIGERLFVYDWESAEMDTPLSWDRFHFQIQTFSLLKRRPIRSSSLAANRVERGLLFLYLLSSARRHMEEESSKAACAIDYRHQLLLKELSAEGK